MFVLVLLRVHDVLVPHLELLPFQATPQVDFSHVRVGVSVCRTFTVRNPTGKSLSLAIEGYGVEKLKDLAFHIDGHSHTSSNSLTVPAGGVRSIVATWTPSEHGTLRENVILKSSSGARFHVLLQGQSVVHNAKTEVTQAQANKHTNNTNNLATFASLNTHTQIRKKPTAAKNTLKETKSNVPPPKASQSFVLPPNVTVRHGLLFFQHSQSEEEKKKKITANTPAPTAEVTLPAAAQTYAYSLQSNGSWLLFFFGFVPCSCISSLVIVLSCCCYCWSNRAPSDDLSARKEDACKDQEGGSHFQS